VERQLFAGVRAEIFGPAPATVMQIQIKGYKGPKVFILKFEVEFKNMFSYGSFLLKESFDDHFWF
jgi:hypothetical protein